MRRTSTGNCRRWNCTGFNGGGSDTLRVPHGEPYAGKLHVRFDEGAGVPCGGVPLYSTPFEPLIHPPRRPSATLLQPPRQPSFNRLPTTTHTLIARASSHLPRQGRTSSSLPHRDDFRHPQPIHPTLTLSSPTLLTQLATLSLTNSFRRERRGITGRNNRTIDRRNTSRRVL